MCVVYCLNYLSGQPYIKLHFHLLWCNAVCGTERRILLETARERRAAPANATVKESRQFMGAKHAAHLSCR